MVRPPFLDYAVSPPDPHATQVSLGNPVVSSTAANEPVTQQAVPRVPGWQNCDEHAALGIVDDVVHWVYGHPSMRSEGQRRSDEGHFAT